MDKTLLEELKKRIKGDVLSDDATLDEYSNDASIFTVRPQVVVCPKDDEDIKELVKFVNENKSAHPELSLTARAAGTDMSGGAINTSIIVSFAQYFNQTPTIEGDIAKVQPGVYYRDFEKETLKHGLLYYPYPSSREICAMGGIVNNNAGGEKSLGYGKAENYVTQLKMVLADGNEYDIKPLNEQELQNKMNEDTFEGKLYKSIYELINNNYDMIMQAKPDVSKNSAGYYLWNVYDKEKKIFDLNKLFVGAQGTLGIMAQASLKLLPVKKEAEMLVIYVNDLSHLAEIVNVILPYKPESLETYDDITLRLALKYYASFGKKLETHSNLETFMKFLPEFKMQWLGHLPKLTIQAEFTSDDRKELDAKIKEVHDKLKQYNLQMKIAPTKDARLKYWLLRRESFGLLRDRVVEMYSSPFIDDFVVKPEYLPEFLPKLNAILTKYPSVIGTFAGHVGNGNFHVIPLIKLDDMNEQKHIPAICGEVFALVKQYHGSTSGEHNDGYIRTPYLNYQYDDKILDLFQKTKQIFDPQNIFNPHKKVNPDREFAFSHVRTTWKAKKELEQFKKSEL
jgi:FAD/FMN-containing dehydrogenase